MTYRSHADLGGQSGHGRVIPEPEGELFHAAWEPKALALTLAMGATGAWNIDISRSARETLSNYESLSYYALWIEGLQKLLAERGLVKNAEVLAGRMLDPPIKLPRILKSTEVAQTLAKGASTQRTPTRPARFALGDKVLTRQGDVPHHTRLPHYARGKVGRIDRIHGAHVFADTNAQSLGEQPQWLYTVEFNGRELWGNEAATGLTVSIDAWEPYLEFEPQSAPGSEPAP
jgi:nitrile hydratase subunit beta